MLMLGHEFQSVESDRNLLQFYHTQLIAQILKLGNGQHETVEQYLLRAIHTAFVAVSVSVTFVVSVSV